MVQYPIAGAVGAFELTDAGTLGLTFPDGNTSKGFRGLTYGILLLFSQMLLTGAVLCK